MTNIAASSIALSLVGCDSEKNPYKKQIKVTEKITDLTFDSLDLSSICTNPMSLFKPLVDKGILSPENVESLMAKTYYVTQGKTDGGFYELIAELEQIKQDMENLKNLETSNAKTL